MIATGIVDKPGIFDKWDVHALEWWWEVDVADWLCVPEYCSVIIDVILFDVVALFHQISFVEGQLATLDSLA